MSKKANPTVIGAFVIGAVVLIAIATALFGGAELFADRTRAVSYFPGSIKGLRVGSNVLARGVRVGYVTDIQILVDIGTLETQVQVTMEIFPEAFKATREGKVIGSVAASGRSVQSIVDAGLRAQLNLESFVTGQLLVELDFHPKTPPLFRGEDPPYTEIPTIPSNIQQVLENVQRFVSDLQASADIGSIVSDAASVIAGLDRIINSEDLAGIVAGLNELINAEETQRLTADLQKAVADLRATLKDTRTFVNNTGDRFGELKENLQPAIASLDSALQKTEQAMIAARRQLGTDSETSYELVNTLNEVQAAARSLRLLAEYLEQHPEALIRGKNGE